MSQFKWDNVGGAITLLDDTQLAPGGTGLANGTLSALGSETNNTSGYQMGQLTVALGSAAFVAPSTINIYIVPSTDLAGAAYPTFTSAAAAALSNYLVATIYINGSTAAQKETYPYVSIPPGKFKALALTGNSCPALANSGNSVTLYPTPSTFG